MSSDSSAGYHVFKDSPRSPGGMNEGRLHMVQRYCLTRFGQELSEKDAKAALEYMGGKEPPIKNRNDPRFEELFDILGLGPGGHKTNASTCFGSAPTVQLPVFTPKTLDMKAPRVFISYRRSHSGAARSLKLHLKNLGYSDVFFDLDRDSGLKAGPFQDQLELALARVDVVFVLITDAPSGPKGDWRFGLSSTETMKQSHAKGLTDYCSVEITKALAQGKLVVPIYPGRHGNAWIGKQLKHLERLDALKKLQSLNAYPLHDDQYANSVLAVDAHVREWMKQQQTTRAPSPKNFIFR